MRRVFQVLISFIPVIIGCEDDAKLKPKDYPYFFTENVIKNDSTGVTFSAKVINAGNEEIIQYGFILLDDGKEYILKITDKTNLDDFKLRITSNLEKGKVYIYKAYIQTLKHYIYANEVVFISEGSKAPEIYDFYPKEGFDNSMVTLKGNNFGITSDNFSIYLNDIKSEITLFTNDSIIFKTPETFFYGESVISLKSGSKTIFAKGKFKIIGPSIDSLSRFSGNSGNYLKIYGKNLIQNGKNTEVMFGTFQATILNYSEKEIELIIPFSYNSNDLLVDKSVLIRYKNGLKNVTYSNNFIINKSWERLKPPPFIASWFEKCFVYKNKGYFLDINYKELMEYDPDLDTWFKISDYPGEYRENSHVVAFGDKLFMIGGTYFDGKIYTFWEYDFLTKTWTKRDNTKFSFSQATSFILDNKLFIVTDSSQVWSYGNDNSFTRRNDFPEKIRLFVSYISQDKAYLVNFGQTWEYDYQNDNWIKASSNPFHSSYYYQSTIGFNLYGTCYVLQSGTDLYKLDVLSKNWILTSRYPYYGYGVYKSSFVINDNAYIVALRSGLVDAAPLLFKYQE